MFYKILNSRLNPIKDLRKKLHLRCLTGSDVEMGGGGGGGELNRAGWKWVHGLVIPINYFCKIFAYLFTKFD